MAEEHFTGEILVASRIVDSLSSGLYETPAACLKELVNNSYDADATSVDIFVKPDADRIMVADDGCGLNREEFERHFSRISESHKRDDGEQTVSGRYKVGKIGIGFIAANELCDFMEIISTKAGSDDLLTVTINFAEMRQDPVTRRRSGDDFSKGDYEGTVEETARDDHYTHIFLKDVRGEARGILAGARRAGVTGPAASLYGMKPETVVSRLRGGRYASWQDLDRYSQTLLEVGLNVPVKYAPNWCPPECEADLDAFASEVANLNFAVTYDGADLRKPVVLGEPGGKHLVRTFEIREEALEARGYLFAQHGILKPRQLRGLLIRIRHAAVGDYDSGFLDFPSGTGQLFQGWISAEVWAGDQLEEAMNIDRKTLRATHPAVLELQRRVHEELSGFLADIRRELWAAGSDARKADTASGEMKRLRAVAARPDLPLTKRERSAIGEAFKARRGGRGASKRPVLRQYSVSELYDTVLEVAADYMEPAQFRRFVRALTDRLRGS